MALSATIHKAELSISDMDRHYYATHELTLARHPSETPRRLMARLLAFMLYADERLQFGRGLSDDDEPALWRKDYSDHIEQWIDVGQPDPVRVRKACSRADQVVVLNHEARAADMWWAKVAALLERHRNLAVLTIDDTAMSHLDAVCQRAMRLQCLIQDGELQILGGPDTFAVRPQVRMGAYVAV